MSPAICTTTGTRPYAPGDAPVMHGEVRVAANRTHRLERDGVEIKKGTLVLCEPRPLWVGQVTRIAANALMTIRWWNTETLKEQATIEMPDDPYLHFLVPTAGLRAVPLA